MAGCPTVPPPQRNLDLSIEVSMSDDAKLSSSPGAPLPPSGSGPANESSPGSLPGSLSPGGSEGSASNNGSPAPGGIAEGEAPGQGSGVAAGSAASSAEPAAASAELPAGSPGRRVRERLEEARKKATARLGKVPGLQVCRFFTGEIDTLLRAHFRQTLAASKLADSIPKRMALLALGGYGRREMCLYSDVDLLFVFKSDPRPEEEEFVKAFLYPLWDLGLDLGQAIRTEAACLEVVGGDMDSTTALVENRLLAGSEEIRNRVTERLRRKLSSPEGAKWYVEAKLADVRQRHAKFGNSIYVLEPHVKEGCGALRDIHAMLWLSFVVFGSPTLEMLGQKGAMSATEVKSLHKAMGFLLDVRNALHALDRRKTDHLTFERQIRVAEMLGFKAGENALAEEQLMRKLYAMARNVQRMANRVVGILQRHALIRERGASAREPRVHVAGPFFMRKGQWLVVDEKHRHRFRREPDLIMKAFSLAAGLGIRVRQDLRDWIANSVGHADDAFRRSPVNRDLFLGILRGPANVFQTLHDMHDCGALGAYIPEFDLVRHLPRIDFYHQYTVDEHLLLATKFAEQFRTGVSATDQEVNPPNGSKPATPPPTDGHTSAVAQGIRRWDLFILALLFHDVGKGEGRGHVIRGGHIIERITERMNLTRPERDVCRLLVLNHQKMSHIAQRRNVEDPKVAQDLAAELEDRELLRMLYVMTVCDLKSVGSTVLNDWRAKLLRELFERTKDQLYANRPTPEFRKTQRSVTPEKVLQLLADRGRADIRKPDVDRFQSAMPERYLVSTTAPEMATHLLLSRDLTPAESVQWRLDALSGRNYSQLTVAATDAPGLFSHICGALASRGINILAAQIYTGTHGICLDVFHVQNRQGEPIEDGPWLDRLRKRLIRTLAGEQEPQWEVESDSLLTRKYKSFLTPDRLAIRPTSVEFNNTASNHHTVIEIKSPDRPGLLYSITRVMDAERINIDLALIVTEAYRIVDVFYVTDWDNNKLEGESRLGQLKKALLAVIDPAPGGEKAKVKAKAQTQPAPDSGESKKPRKGAATP